MLESASAFHRAAAAVTVIYVVAARAARATAVTQQRFIQGYLPSAFTGWKYNGHCW